MSNLTVGSCFTVITIGLWNCWSEHLSYLILCFLSNSLLSSVSTVPVSAQECDAIFWMGVASLLNCFSITWFIDFPFRTHSCWKFFVTNCLISGFDSSGSCMFSIWLRFGFSWISFIPICGKMFLPIILVFRWWMGLLVFSVQTLRFWLSQKYLLKLS